MKLVHLPLFSYTAHDPKAEIMAAAPEGVRGVSSPPPPHQKEIKPKKMFKRSVTNAFHCLVFLASNLVLRFASKNLKLLILPYGALFFSQIFSQHYLNIGTICEQKCIRYFNPLSGKNYATVLEIH